MSTAIPLVDRLTNEFNYPTVTTETITEFLNENEFSVLFFTEDAKQFPETLDVAVVLPELMQIFPQIKPAIIAREDEEHLKSQFNFYAWPALVFMRKTEHLETITKIQDWGVYLEKIKQILTTPSASPDGMSIPITTIN